MSGYALIFLVCTKFKHIRNCLILRKLNICQNEKLLKKFSVANVSSNNPVDLSFSTFKPDRSHSSKVPVVILHGLLGSKHNWRGLAKAISKKSERQVFVLDARNHGESPHVDEFSYNSMMNDVKLFLKSQKLPEAVMIGHSMGGRTAMYLALTNPQLVNKLIVVDVAPTKMPRQSQLIPTYMRAMKAALADLQDISLSHARKMMDEYLSKSVPEGAIRQFLISNLGQRGEQLVWKPNIDVLLRKFESDVLSFPPVSTNFFGETLFICGGDSPFVEPEDHPKILQLFPKAEFVTIPNAGHWVHSEKPSEFLEAVYEIL